MTTPTRVCLRPGERIFISGAVIKVESRTTLELLNDVPYLVESEIMHPQQTVTPLRQLYFVLQTMVMEPGGIEMARGVYEDTMNCLMRTFANAIVLAGLETISRQVAAGSPFQALKTLRGIIPIEDAILGGNRMAELRVVKAG